MAKPYSMDLRERAMTRLAAGQTTYQVATALQVAVSSVIKWSARQRKLGSVMLGQMGGHRRHRISGDYRQLVLDAVACKSHVTLDQLSLMLKAKGLTVHPASISRFLKREGKSFKKKHTAERAEPTKAGTSARPMARVSRPD
jgi:putative transposase